MSNKQNVKDLHQNYINAGKQLEGFEKYYVQNVIMQEISEEPRVGKDVNHTLEIQSLQSIKEIHGVSIFIFAEDTKTNKTKGESQTDLTFANDFRFKIQLVAVQT